MVYLTEEEARRLYAANDAAHDFDHVLRVTALAERIAGAEGADSTVVRLAALLHDVPVADMMKPETVPNPTSQARRKHHMAAADFARQYLSKRELDAARLENVVHAIEAHRFRDQSIQPQSLEARCLYDADKLDSIGAIGIGRAFAYAGAHDSRLWTEPWVDAANAQLKPAAPDYTPVHEYVYKLRLLLDTLHTETARRLGAERHAFMLTFFDRLDDEIAGVL